MSNIDVFIEKTVTESQTRLEEMARNLLGEKTEIRPSISIDYTDDQFEEATLTEGLSREIVSHITDDFAHDVIKSAIRRVTPTETIRFDTMDMETPDDALRRREKLIVALTKYSARPHHDQSERVIVVSKYIFREISEVLSSHPDIDGMLMENLIYTGTTLHGGKVFVDPMLKGYEGTLILKEGWFTYTGGGVIAEDFDGSVSFYIDNLALIEPDRVIHIAHEVR
jgi:hypothetical protein